jgi:Helix-turn-helix domain
MDSSDDLLVPLEPALLTVEEASRVLRIGRQLAYQLAHEYLASGGIPGIPVIRFGVKNLRVPRWALVELAETGNVVRLCDGRVPTGAHHGD